MLFVFFRCQFPGSGFKGSGFWVQKFQDLSIRFLAVVLFPLTSDDLFLQLSNL
jgi:hypothetical protein